MIHTNKIINRAFGRPIGALLWVVAVFLMPQGIASAQTELPPIIGDTLWTYEPQIPADYNPDDGARGPWHSLAEDAGLLFRVTSSRDILVLDARSGLLKDRLGIQNVTF